MGRNFQNVDIGVNAGQVDRLGHIQHFHRAATLFNGIVGGFPNFLNKLREVRLCLRRRQFFKYSVNLVRNVIYRIPKGLARRREWIGMPGLRLTVELRPKNALEQLRQPLRRQLLHNRNRHCLRPIENIRKPLGKLRELLLTRFRRNPRRRNHR